MRCQNRSKGQTLPFIIILSLVLVLVGVGCFGLMQLLGGHAEHSNATDAGVLNLNKQAVAQSVPVDASSEFQTMFKTCSGINAVDLRSYNRMVSAATIVALNASSDGLDVGVKNATSLINELQGSQQSLGAKLKNLLDDPGADWANQCFDTTALRNSERMLDKNSTMKWDKSLYKVAYLESAGADLGASNIPVDKLLENMPLAYDDNGMTGKGMEVPKNMVASDGGSKFMRGYQAITIPNISTPIYAVPTQPNHQPHLVSLSTFSSDQYSKQPGIGKVFLPPNGFQGGAKAGNAISKDILVSSTSAGIVGLPSDQSPAQARLPQGFLVIDNSMETSLNTAVPNGDNWEACEAGTGTLVYRPKHIFSTDSVVGGKGYNALASWLQTPRSGSFDPKSGPAIVDDDGNALLYDGSGNPIMTKEDAAQQIPYDPSPNNTVLATDQNSDPNGNNPDVDCTMLATPTYPDNLSPFNRAYHPNANAGNGNSTGRNLIASEQAKLYALGLYGPQYRAGSRGVYSRNFGLTGLRLYPNGMLPNIGGPYTYAPNGCSLPMGNPQRVPYGDPSVLGKVTTDGTIQELFQQTTGSPKTSPYVRIDNDSSHSKLVQDQAPITPCQEVQNFIIQRMKEIKPGASSRDFDKVFQQKLPLGTRYFVYLQNPSNPNSDFVVSSTPPNWATSLTADGKRHAFSTTYPISAGSRDTGYMIDAHNDFGIHDHLFMTNRVVANATDAVSYQSSSGANGLLGYVKFIEFVQASGSLTIPN